MSDTSHRTKAPSSGDGAGDESAMGADDTASSYRDGRCWCGLWRSAPRGPLSGLGRARELHEEVDGELAGPLPVTVAVHSVSPVQR